MNSSLENVIRQACTILLGKESVVKLSLACLLAKGHLLIEDIPGVGKTTLAHALAHLLGLEYRRIQFTSDLLPADVVGVSIFDRKDASFSFHQGPIFSQVLLADEINRATPKAQSALLEAMEERQVSVEGTTYPLPKPFFVIATQNPGFQIGTYPLPESQLDRFLMRICIGFPDAQAELELLKGVERRDLLSRMEPVLNSQELIKIQQQVESIHTSDAIYNYCQALLAYTRSSDRFYHGLSPRAGMGLLNAARAWALIEGRDMVLPEDIQAVLPSVTGHRLQGGNDNETVGGESLVHHLLQTVPVA